MADDSSIVFRVDADDQDAQKKLNDLRKDIEKTAKALDSTNAKHNGIVDALEAAKAKAKETQAEIQRVQEAINQNTAQIYEGKTGGGGAMIHPEEYERLKAANNALMEKRASLQAQLVAEQKEVSKLATQEERVSATLSQQTEQLEKQKSDYGQVEAVVAKQASSTMPRLASAAEAANKAVKKGVKNILKLGIGISLIRKLGAYTKEAVKAFAETDAETKANIDGLKASLQTLKLSWGAAFAPIINAIIPLLQKLISWLTAAANAVAQFFAALGGKTTYKRAVAGNNALADSYGAAGAAAEEAEKQIMGFDEINKLSADKSGGGGGGGAGGAQYEEVPINEKILDLVKKIKDHFREIAILAGIIGSAILAWKLAHFLSDLGLIADKLQFAVGIIMSIAGAALYVYNYFKAWTEGVNWDNLTGILIGAALLVGGLALAFGTTASMVGLLIVSIGGLVLAIKDWITTGELSEQTAVLLSASLLGIGIAISVLTGSWIPLLVAGFGMIVAGIIDWVKTGELGTEAFYLMEAGIAVVGVALALLTGSWIPLLIAAIAGLALYVVKHWDQIKEKTANLVNSIKEKFNDLKNKFEEIKRDFAEKFEKIHEKAADIVRRIKELFNFEWHFPKPKLPHFTVDWEDWGIISIPRVSVDWYAKGGIFDKASLIGVGEAGREAVMPLDRNTGWIKELAEKLLDSMESKYSGALNGLPAMANGTVAPPMAMSGSGFNASDIADVVSSALGTMGQTQKSGTKVAIFNVNGREFMRAVWSDLKTVESEHGISLITNG